MNVLRGTSARSAHSDENSIRASETTGVRVHPLGQGERAGICLEEAAARSEVLLIADSASARGHRISTREHFREALTHVNSVVRREDISVPEAKEVLTRAEALRAWASFDKRLTKDEKKEANRAMTRTVLMLAALAEREQPNNGSRGRRGKLPGPVAWLRRELGMSNAKAAFARRLLHGGDRIQEILDLGCHWLTGIGNGEQRGQTKNTILNRMRQFASVNNSLVVALKIAPNMLPRELTRIRNIKAWCEAYESALVQRKARSAQTENAFGGEL